MSNSQYIREKIDSWFSENSESMIDDLSKLIAINSVRAEKKDGAPFGEKSREALSVAESIVKDRGFAADVFEDMVVTTSYGPKPEQLGILAHLDIVAAGEGWETDPFKLTEKDGVLYGRGVVDNKGPAIAAIYALSCVRDVFPEITKGVQIILGSAEETGFEDIQNYTKHNKTPPNLFTPDAEFPIVNIEKGRFVSTFGAKWEKDTALPRIVEIIGGSTPNIVPNKATAKLDGFTLEEVTRYCKDYTSKTGVTLSACSGVDGCCENDGLVHIQAGGTASHASMPELGNNAQLALIEMLAAMPFAKSDSFDNLCKLNRLFPYGDHNAIAFGLNMKDDLTGEITLNFGVLRFTEHEFSGTFDSRTPACADDVSLAGKTREILEKDSLSYSYHSITKSHHTPEDSPFVQKLLGVYEEYTGNEGKCLAIGGGTYVHGIPGGVAFGCVMPGSEDHNNIHNAGEYTRKDQMIINAKMFTKAIVDICS